MADDDSVCVMLDINLSQLLGPSRFAEA